MLKTSEVDLRGIKPQTVLDNSQQPPPFESIGFQKAKAILDATPTQKTAGIRHGQGTRLPQIQRLTKEDKKDGPPPDLVDKAVSVGGHTLAGAGAGRFLTEFAHGTKLPDPAKFHAAKWKGTAIGGALGLAGLARKKYRQAKFEKQKTGSSSPGMALKSSQQIGRKDTNIGSDSGPSVQQQIRSRLMGKKFVAPAMQGEKIASAGEEELHRMKATVLTRDDQRAAADALFGGVAMVSRQADRDLIKKLFVQSPGAETMAPTLQKEASITPALDAFFEKNAKALGLTEAQLRYPELLKVAAGRSAMASQPTPDLSKRKVTANSGPDAVKSSLSGGSA